MKIYYDIAMLIYWKVKLKVMDIYRRKACREVSEDVTTKEDI